MIFLRIVLSLGDAAAAAHGVAIQVEALGYMPGGAFQVSAAAMAGQYLGARDLVRARYSVIQTCFVAAAVMVIAGVIFYVAATPLARDERTKRWSVTLALRDGEHRYAFVVDGTRWVPDPRAQRSTRGEDGRIYSLLSLSRTAN